MRVLYAGDPTPTGGPTDGHCRGLSDIAAMAFPDAAGFNTDDPCEARDLARIYDYDLIVLDDALIGPDLPTWLADLRDMGVATPVLVVGPQAPGDGELAAAVLAAGADDYIRLPALAVEMVARARLAHDRAALKAWDVIEVGDLRLDPNSKRVEVCGADVALTGKEYQLLEFMLAQQGLPVSRRLVVRALYGPPDDDAPGEQIADILFDKLARKLCPTGRERHHLNRTWISGFHVELDAPAPRPSP